MFGSVGTPELIIIFVIALIVFGPRKLPELGKSLGKSLAEFKRASNELKSTLDEEIRLEERKNQERQQPEKAQLDAARVADFPVETVGSDPHAPATGTHDSTGTVPRQNGSA